MQVEITEATPDALPLPESAFRAHLLAQIEREGVLLAARHPEHGRVGTVATCLEGEVCHFACLRVDPLHRGKGVARQLVEEAAKRSIGWRGRIFYSALVNPGEHAALALMARLGATPRAVFLAVEGAPAPAGPEVADAQRLRAQPITDVEPLLAQFRWWDEAITRPRDDDHRFLASPASGARGFTFHAPLPAGGERVVGYAYAHSDGHLGPVALADSEYVAQAYAFAAREAARRAPGGRVHAYVPASAVTGVKTLVNDLGLRIAREKILVSSRIRASFWDVALPWRPERL